MTSPLSASLDQWTRDDRRRRLLERAPAAVAAVAGLGLVARGMAGWSTGAALLALGLGAAALVAAAWRPLRRAWTRPADLAAHIDRAGGTHDLLQTALAVEAGAAVGSPALGAGVLAEARRRAPELAQLASRPPRFGRAAPALAVGLLVLHAVLFVRPGPAPGGGPAAPAPDDALAALPGAPADPDRGAPPAAPPDDPATGGAALTATEQASRRGTRGTPGSAADELEVAAPGGGPDAVGATEAEAEGIDPMWAATDIWTPGAGGGENTEGQLGQGARTGQEQAGNAGLNPDGDLAATTDAPEEAAGGDAPSEGEGQQGDAAREDLMTVQEGDGLAEDEPGDDEAPDDEEGGAPGEGEGQEADDPEEGQDGKGPPPDELTGKDDELGKGEESAGAPGAGGANDAGGSARSEATRRPPEWEVAAEWVAGQWRDAPAQVLEQVEEGRTGRRSSRAWQDLVRNYAALAEAASTPEAVPPTRRAYVGAYFDALSAPAEPPAEPTE